MIEYNEQQFLAAEHQVELQSAELKKELRLGDLVFSQIVYIIGLQWIGTAAKLGPSHIMFWIPAVLLFYIPSAMVVVHLNQEMPLEGGLYQWAKLRYGDLMGFLVAVNLWATMVLLLASGVAQLNDNIAYFIGPSASWMAESRVAVLTVAAAQLIMLVVLCIRGLATAKWLHNAGGFVIPVALIGMIAVAIPRWFHGSAVMAPVAFTPPAVTLFNLNLLGKMGFGAFSGFDGCAIFSGEIHDPDVPRIVRRSVWIAAPIIALFYIVGTACVLAFTKPDGIDLISPTTQVLSLGSRGFRFGALFASVGAGLMIANLFGGSSIYFNALVRLPMVAGWDHLLPKWISRLHPRYRTPVGSILFIGGTTFVLTVLGHLGVGAQESFQLLNNAALLCWALTYLVMFSIPLLAAGEKPPLPVRIASASGFGMTLLYLMLSVFPIVDVQNVGLFAAKTGGVVVAINAAGYWHFRRVHTRARAAAA